MTDQAYETMQNESAYETMQNESVPAQVYEQLQNESNMAQQPNTVTPQHTVKPPQPQPQPVTQPPAPAPASYPAQYVVQTNVPQAQPMSVANPTTTPPGTRKDWAHDSALRISVIIIVSGILLFIMNIPGIVIHAEMWNSGIGFWGGAFIIITGGIGIGAAKRKTNGFITAWMVLTIILASFLAFILVGMFSSGISIETRRQRDSENGYFSMPGCITQTLYNYTCDHSGEWKGDIFCRVRRYGENKYVTARSVHCSWGDRNRGGAIALYGIGVVIVSLLVIISIVGSALTCRAVCCKSRPRPVQVVYVPTGSANVQFYPAGTNVVYPNAGQHPQTVAQYPANQPPTMVYPAGHPPNVHSYQPAQATGGGFNPPPYTEKQPV